MRTRSSIEKLLLPTLRERMGHAIANLGTVATDAVYRLTAAAKTDHLPLTAVPQADHTLSHVRLIPIEATRTRGHLRAVPDLAVILPESIQPSADAMGQPGLINSFSDF